MTSGTYEITVIRHLILLKLIIRFQIATMGQQLKIIRHKIMRRKKITLLSKEAIQEDFQENLGKNEYLEYGD